MLTQRVPGADARLRTAAGALPCTYLVDYPGQADDTNEWLAYYIAHHPQIMARFPGHPRDRDLYPDRLVRLLPWQRVEHLQRNKGVFDSPAALTAALNSPVRHEMRADFNRFPPYRGAQPPLPRWRPLR